MSYCSICGGAVGVLGVLGNLAHLICRDCGAAFNVPAEEMEEADTEEDGED